jgi:spermidine synthase
VTRGRLEAAAAGRSVVSLPFYLTVALVSGAIIAFQIGVMRVYSIGSWAHFGSLVISIAMLGFGVVSAVMCIGKDSFERHWSTWVRVSLLAYGPLMIAGNTAAQAYPFNPIFLAQDPGQKYRLFASFIFYFVPFVPGALFLGLAFLKGKAQFGKVYFANMAGSGLGGLLFLGSMYLVMPDWLLLVPLGMWFVAVAIWFGAARERRALAAAAVLTVLAVVCAASFTQIYVLPYKGVSYAKKFPDSQRIYAAASPLGLMEVYTSSYFHFAPGLSDMAAINLKKMPENAYLGMYIDGDGPIGIMKQIPRDLTAYFRFLPMYMPYLLNKDPNVFVVQFGGGISTEVALRAGAPHVTVAEGNPRVLDALGRDPTLTKLTDDVLADKRVTIVPYDGRLYVAGAHGKFDIVDFSLADSTGLSSAGGFSIYEKYGYTKEAMLAYMAALRDNGILSVTVWNKQDPPKSVLKLFTTMVAAAQELDPGDYAKRFFVSQGYLSTVTVLYKRNGFTPAEVETLRDHNKAMSFDVAYYPGMQYDASDAAAVFQGYRDVYFAPPKPERPGVVEGEAANSGAAKEGEEQTETSDAASGPQPGQEEEVDSEKGGPDISANNLYRLVLNWLMTGKAQQVTGAYVFDTKPLTNDRPYFAGYIKVLDIPAFIDKFENISDDWGYLLLWATLLQSLIFGAVLILIPVIWGWKTIFARQPGKLGIIAYFMCLGLGYIIVEVGLISKFMLALTNPTISASVLITGMLLFSGMGSLFSGRFLDRCTRTLPPMLIGVGALLVIGAFAVDPILNAIGEWPYFLRIVACLVLLFPLAFLMGFPFATGMAMLSRLGKDRFFLWAWGINGCFSVVGAVLVPIVAVVFGLSTLLIAAGVIYLAALPAFFSLLRRPADAAAA